MATLSATLTIETFRAEGDGCLGYLVVDEASRTAVAIDPRLDLVERFQAALAAHDAHLTHVLDTLRMPTTCRAYGASPSERARPSSRTSPPS